MSDIRHLAQRVLDLDATTHAPGKEVHRHRDELVAAAPDLARALVAEQGRVADLEAQLTAANTRADAAVRAAVDAERARMLAALRSAWADVIDVGAGKGGVYITGAHAIYEPMLASVGRVP